MERFAAWYAQERAADAAAREVAAAQPARSTGGPPDDTCVRLDTATTALVLGVSPRYVARMAVTERLPGVRSGRGWWFRRSDVDQQAAARTFLAAQH